MQIFGNKHRDDHSVALTCIVLFYFHYQVSALKDNLQKKKKCTTECPFKMTPLIYSLPAPTLRGDHDFLPPFSPHLLPLLIMPPSILLLLPPRFPQGRGVDVGERQIKRRGGRRGEAAVTGGAAAAVTE